MTISQAASPSESLLIGAHSSPATSSPAPVLYRDFGAPRPLPLPNTSTLESLLEEFEEDPDMAVHMADARRRMSQTVYAEEPETLSALRLAAGMSQAQLAAKIKSCQSHIARIEKGQNDPGTEMISRIADALGIDELLAFRAIRNQVATRGQGR